VGARERETHTHTRGSAGTAPHSKGSSCVSTWGESSRIPPRKQRGSWRRSMNGALPPIMPKQQVSAELHFSMAAAWAGAVTTEWAMATCIGRPASGGRTWTSSLNHEGTLGVHGAPHFSWGRAANAMQSSVQEGSFKTQEFSETMQGSLRSYTRS